MFNKIPILSKSSFLLLEVESWNIVNRGEWLWSLANIKRANKDAMIYVARSTTVHNLLLCAHTLCMNYITEMFLFASSSVRSIQLLCFVRGKGQKSKQKRITKNLVGFHNYFPLITMVEMWSSCLVTMKTQN